MVEVPIGKLDENPRSDGLKAGKAINILINKNGPIPVPGLVLETQPLPQYEVREEAERKQL